MKAEWSGLVGADNEMQILIFVNTRWDSHAGDNVERIIDALVNQIKAGLDQVSIFEFPVIVDVPAA